MKNSKKPDHVSFCYFLNRSTELSNLAYFKQYSYFPIRVPNVFTYFPFVFTRVHSFSFVFIRFHSFSFVFIRFHSFSFVLIRFHSCSLVFIRVPLVFIRVPLVFHSCSTRVPLVFTLVHSCSTRVHSCSLVFTRVHSCSLVFIRVPLVFTRVHSCSFVLRSVWCFRYDLSDVLVLIRGFLLYYHHLMKPFR